MTPDAYCQDKAARRGSTAYYAQLFLEPELRRHVNALSAFRTELSNVVEECSDMGVARIKKIITRYKSAKCCIG